MQRIEETACEKLSSIPQLLKFFSRVRQAFYLPQQLNHVARALTKFFRDWRCGLIHPRMHDMLRGRISRFSLDALVNMATRLERVQV